MSMRAKILDPSSSVRNISSFPAISNSSPRDRMPPTVLLIALKTPLREKTSKSKKYGDSIDIFECVSKKISSAAKHRYNRIMSQGTAPCYRRD
jgi:hypothetical protein